MKIPNRPLIAGITAFIVWCTSSIALLAQGQAGTNIQIVPLKDTSEDTRRFERNLSVQVQDKSTGPVGGAQVTFTVPDGQPGRFPNQERMLMVYSDPRGLAVAKGFQIMNGARQVNVNVDAFYKGSWASTTMTSGRAVERFVASRSKKAAILGIAGAAAAAGAFFIVRSARTPNATAPGGVSVRLGGTQVGAP